MKRALNQVEWTEPPGAEVDEVDDAAERRAFVVGASMHGLRLDRVLAEEVPAFSRTYLQKLLQAGEVSLDGQPCQTASRKLVLGQQVEIRLCLPPEITAFRPQAIPLDVLYEDEELLVINKPAGMVMHPAAGNWSGTVLNALLAHHAAACHLPRAGIVHRLDKDTSGLFVAGKTLASTQALSEAIARRDVQRTYWAMAQGPWTGGRAVSIEHSIGRDPRSKIRMAVLASGRQARTDVEVLKQVVLEERGRPLLQLKCRLHTGRTHQIRVHLASIGHPLIADAVYGGVPLLGLERQALHARTLVLTHPKTGERLSFDAPLPSDFAVAWNLLESCVQTRSL